MIKKVVARTSRQLRHRVKTFLGTRPGLYFPVFRNRGGYDDLLVQESTDICIEGFPRSANSFAAGAFEHAQANEVKIAHHTHVAANAMQACNLGVPTIVLIRNPVDAVISNVSLAKEVHLVEHGKLLGEDELIGFRPQISAWTAFYSALKPYQEAFVTAPFSRVIRDMGAVIRATNAYFGTSFTAFQHSEENAARVHQSRGYHAGPNERRASIKERTRTSFDQTLKPNAHSVLMSVRQRHCSSRICALPTLQGEGRGYAATSPKSESRRS